MSALTQAKSEINEDTQKAQDINLSSNAESDRDTKRPITEGCEYKRKKNGQICEICYLAFFIDEEGRLKLSVTMIVNMIKMIQLVYKEKNP